MNPDQWSGFIHVLVGLAGFEPTTSSSRTKRATKLRYSPQGEVTLSDDLGCNESQISGLNGQIGSVARPKADRVGVGLAGQKCIGGLT